MRPARREHGWVRLASVLLLALAYAVALQLADSLTGRSTVDGTIGVVLGLFVCSQPAANAVDALFYDRFGFTESLSGWAGRSWLALNVLVFMVGWSVITMGTTQLVRH
jgi:hypothetical protein